jgi:hypothetical protein
MPTSIPNVARREIMRLRAAVRSRSGAVSYEEDKHINPEPSGIVTAGPL